MYVETGYCNLNSMNVVQPREIYSTDLQENTSNKAAASPTVCSAQR